MKEPFAYNRQTLAVVVSLLIACFSLTGYAQSLVLLSEDFEESGMPSGWLSIDSDGDSYGWDCDRTASPHNGLECAGSASFINDIGSLTPDNWLISPALDLTGYSSIELSYWVAAQDRRYSTEHLELWVSTTGKDPDDFTDQVDDYTETDNTWKERVLDLSAYVGETIYLAFRHCESTDMYWIRIDDISVHGAGLTVPFLKYSPTSQHFGLLQEGQSYEATFEIWNQGAGMLDWTLSTTEPWLTCFPLTGSSTDEPNVVTITVEATGLPSGSYNAAIEIESNGGTGIVEVQFKDNWPGFRGPGGMGVSDTKGLPLRWDTSQGCAWKTLIQGGGDSSPIVFGDHIYLTFYSGYAVPQQARGSLDQLKLHLLALNRDTGDKVWEEIIPARQGERENVRDHGYAANTPVADAHGVYAFFGKTGVFAFDHDGRQRWKADVGSGTHSWGTGASLLLYGDLLIVNASIESQSLVALDRASGNVRWRVSGIEEAWNTPLVITADSGRRELIIARRKDSQADILALDPDTGDSLWSCYTGIYWYMVPTVVANEGVIYYQGGGSRKHAGAVRAGGSGDVTATHRLWTGETGSNVTSPIYLDGHLYWMHESSGRAYCAEADTGNLVYNRRLSGADKVYASPILADGWLYYLDRNGKCFILPAKPEFENPVVNDLRDGTIFDASPAVVGKRILIRSNKYLYCVGE